MKSRVITLFALCAIAGSLSIKAQLFPQSLHLSRSIIDPVGGESRVEEYLSGNRMMSIRGERSVIVDYRLEQITVIDRVAGTYSITSFEDFAATRPAARSVSSKSNVAAEWELKPEAPATLLGHAAATTEAENTKVGSDLAQIRVSVDRTIELTEEGFDALVGSRYPASPDETQQVVRRIATLDRAAAKGAVRLALPLETTVTYVIGGKKLVSRNSVTAVKLEEPPAQLSDIPSGAVRVASPFVSLQHELDQLDRPKRER